MSIRFLTLVLLFNDVFSFTMMKLLPSHMNNYPSNFPNRRNMLSKSLKLLPVLPLLPVLTKSSQALTNDENNQIKIYNNTVASVCYIITDYNVSHSFLTQNPKGIGSGFIYDTPAPHRAHIVTNFHVINYAKNATVKMLNKDGITKEYIPKVKGYDIDKDIAVLEVDVAP